MNALSEKDPRWTGFYKIAAVASLLIVLVGLVDIVTSMLGGEAQMNSAVSIEDWFTLFQTDRLAALGNLGLFNILTLSLGIPLNLALFNAHRQNHRFAALAAILANMQPLHSGNTIFSIQALSNQYATASEAQKPCQLGGRALLAQGRTDARHLLWASHFTQSAGLPMALY
jgi:hypothetical protein